MGSVGGLDSLRKEFNRYIIWRIKHPKDYEELGVDFEVGFMLYGPPRCGKTLIAKAVANDAGANFIHIKGPEILSKYVGESEQKVKKIFSHVDALTTMQRRQGTWVVEPALNQLLKELDGANNQHGVYVIGATNRLELIDPAVLQPGRFGRVFYVPLPSADERGLILKTLARKKLVSPDFDYTAFTSKEACKNLTGTDLAALVNEAAMIVKEEKKMHVDQGISYDDSLVIKTAHFDKALEKIIPSVLEERRHYYETMAHNFSAT